MADTDLANGLTTEVLRQSKSPTLIMDVIAINHLYNSSFPENSLVFRLNND